MEIDPVEVIYIQLISEFLLLGLCLETEILKS